MLKGIDITRKFGEHQVLNGINIDIPDQSLVMLCGRSGSGKTTLINILGGLDAQTSGEVIFENQKFSALSAKELEKIRRYKMGFVFQSVALVPSMNAYENVDFALRIVNDRKDADARVKKALALVGLESRMTHMVPQLSGGEQQMLAMGRALMSHPDIILMDEPSMGLSPIFVNEIFNIIRDVNKDGVTVLLVEQNAKKALSIANRAYVLETGKIVKEGNAADLLNDESIKKAYLGE